MGIFLANERSRVCGVVCGYYLRGNDCDLAIPQVRSGNSMQFVDLTAKVDRHRCDTSLNRTTLIPL